MKKIKFFIKKRKTTHRNELLFAFFKTIKK